MRQKNAISILEQHALNMFSKMTQRIVLGPWLHGCKVDGQGDESGEALIPEGQSLVIPRWQSAEFFRQAKDIDIRVL